MDARLKRRSLAASAVDLWAATYVLLGLRYSGDVARVLLQRMVSMKESVTYQAIVEEGRVEGLAKGRAEGAVDEAKRLLFLGGETRFGSPPPEIAMMIHGIGDLPCLEAMYRRLFQAQSWDELLGRRKPRRLSGRGRRRE